MLLKLNVVLGGYSCVQTPPCDLLINSETEILSEH
jgi:hypothetical protein